MRKAEWGSVQNSCGVCKTPGHNRRSCPKVPELAKQCQVILDSGVPIDQIPKNLMSAYEENEARKHRKTTKPRKQRRCTFCGETNHTKRNCPAKVKYRDLLYEANRCWRRGFIEDLNKSGFGIGCLLCIKQTFGLGHMPLTSTQGKLRNKKITYAVVSEIPWEKMTFMAKYNGRWEYQTDYTFKATTTCGFPFRISELEMKELLKTNKLHINNSWVIPKDFLSIHSPVTPQPPENWLTSGTKVGQIEWLIDDLSASKLEDYGIIDLARKIIKLFP